MRNTAVAAGTGGLLALLLNQPTSTNSKPQQDAILAGMSNGRSTADEVEVTGPLIPTGVYGPVQVRAWLREGRVVTAKAIVYPHLNFVDDYINAAALPQLDASAIAYGNGRVDTVTAATYTSDAYGASLQAAVDAAHAAAAPNATVPVPGHPPSAGLPRPS